MYQTRNVAPLRDMFRRRDTPPAPADAPAADTAVTQLPSGDLAVAVGDDLIGWVRDDEQGFAAVRPGEGVVAVRDDPDAAARVLLEHAS